jgi:hypothetical protein
MTEHGETHVSYHDAIHQNDDCAKNSMRYSGFSTHKWFPER